MKNSRIVSGAFACLAVASFSVDAAVIDVDHLSIDSITIGISVLPAPTTSTTQDFVPPDVWNMGKYGGVLIDSSLSTILGPVNYIIESTGNYGAPPNSGSVDTSLGVIGLNLSDLHMTASGVLSANFDLWSASTSTINSNAYNSTTGAFVYGWSDTTTFNSFAGVTDVNYSITLTGAASVVPVPPAIWLLGSGMLGLAGITRRKMAA